jgi:hypothetical protein
LGRRRYQIVPGESRSAPPASLAGEVDLRGVRERHWELLTLLARHAVLDTGQVAELMFGSRPAAVRHLGLLVKAGLVWRFVYEHDPSHLAHYQLSTDGVRHLTQRLRASRVPVPVNMGREHRDSTEVNEVVIGLTRAARASGETAWLYGWRPGADVVLWLHRLGAGWVQPRAAGVWLQDGQAVRFLLHVDDDTPAPISGIPAPRPAYSLRGYRRAPTGVPAGCILVLCATPAREEQLHDDLAAAPLPVPVASTTLDRLRTTGDPSGPIWTAAATDTSGMLRLIDLADT